MFSKFILIFLVWTLITSPTPGALILPAAEDPGATGSPLPPPSSLSKLTCTFDPPFVDQLFEGETIRVTAHNCTPTGPLPGSISSLRFYPVSRNPEIADVKDKTEDLSVDHGDEVESDLSLEFDSDVESWRGEGGQSFTLMGRNESFIVRGVFLGRTVVGFFAENASVDWREGADKRGIDAGENGDGLENGEGQGGEEYPQLVNKYR